MVQYLGGPGGREHSLIHEHVVREQSLPVTRATVHRRDNRTRETGRLTRFIQEMSDLMSMKNICSGDKSLI